MAHAALAVIPDSPDTPAFNLLTDKQKAFVVALMQFGSGKGKRTQCARIAGYDGEDTSLRVIAHQLFHNSNVQAALREITTAHMLSFQLMSIDGIADLAESARDESVKLKALLAIADRTGFNAVQSINVKHEDVNRSEDQMIERMVALVAKNPHLIEMVKEPRRSLVAAKVAALGLPSPASQAAPIDAEYTEITDQRDPDADLLGE